MLTWSRRLRLLLRTCRYEVPRWRCAWFLCEDLLFVFVLAGGGGGEMGGGTAAGLRGGRRGSVVLAVPLPGSVSSGPCVLM